MALRSQTLAATICCWKAFRLKLEVAGMYSNRLGCEEQQASGSVRIYSGYGSAGGSAQRRA